MKSLVMKSIAVAGMMLFVGSIACAQEARVSYDKMGNPVCLAPNAKNKLMVKNADQCRVKTYTAKHKVRVKNAPIKLNAVPRKKEELKLK